MRAAPSSARMRELEMIGDYEVRVLEQVGSVVRYTATHVGVSSSSCRRRRVAGETVIVDLDACG